MKYAYYPGCSLKGTGCAYEESLLAVFRTLGIKLEELNDWNCCGATTYMSYDELQSYGLAARNLSLAKQTGNDLMAPCAACYLVLNKTQYYVRDYPWIGQIVEHALEAIHLPTDISAKVRHPLDILLNDVGLDAVRAKVIRPLHGLKVAPYYGCQMVRPYALFDNQRNPTSMDRLLEACGAEIVNYPVKTQCCGGSQKGTLPEIGLDLIRHLLAEAQRNGAEVISTLCPLCQFNLEAFQEQASNAHQFHFPVLYFTQLLALAFGITLNEAGLQRSFISIKPILAEKEIAYA
ncbi:MAG: CoB--CoM heterodisulfide reductase iron-sulfur subunit B family protein [Terracidiphilus sp.]